MTGVQTCALPISEMIKAAENLYNATVSTSAHARSGAEILRFFDGFDLVDPGLVYVPLWRPDSPADVPSDPGKYWCFAGVGRKHNGKMQP